MPIHIEYDATLDDLLDVSLRWVGQSRAAKRARYWTTFCGVALGGVLVYVMFGFYGSPMPERLTLSGVGIAAGSIYYLFTYRRRLRSRLRKHLREQMQSQPTICFAVELRDEGIWIKQGPTESLTDWSNLREVVDTGDAVELRMHNGQLVVIRNERFPTARDRSEFVKIANEFEAAGSSSSGCGGTENLSGEQ